MKKGILNNCVPFIAEWKVENEENGYVTLAEYRYENVNGNAELVKTGRTKTKKKEDLI